MRKNSFRVISIIMLLIMLTACGSSGSKSTSTDTNATSNGDTASSTDSKATNEEPTEIKVMIWDRSSAAPGTTNEDNALTKYIQEQMLAQYNVKVTYMAVPRSGSDDKVNVMMAGGNAPDIVFTYSQQMFGDYAAKGGLTDLTEAVKAYGENITNYIGDIQVMGTVDGAQYAVMKRRGIQVPRHLAYIRKDWLDALGLAVPTNKVELEAALLAFKEQNPGGVDNVIPWGLGAPADTEKFYLNFIGSYVPEMSEKDAYVYSENLKIFANGGLEGLKEMNRLYNEGLLSKDFAVDTTSDQFYQDLSNGKVGFVLDDSTKPIEYFQVLQTTEADSLFIPINVFDTPEGNYINPTEPLYGMYIMVPKTSEDKAEACVKYLNWLADPTNAENVAFTPEHETDASGVPQVPTEEVRNEKGYPGNLGDYNIVNDHFAYVDTKEGAVSGWRSWSQYGGDGWFENLYDVQKLNQFVYPAVPVVLDAEAKYFTVVQGLAIEYVYKLVSCKSEDFDALQVAEYKKLVDAGLEKIINERAEYYDANRAK